MGLLKTELGRAAVFSHKTILSQDKKPKSHNKWFVQNQLEQNSDIQSDTIVTSLVLFKQYSEEESCGHCVRLGAG